MSDVFISYSRNDRDKAAELAALFERQGWTVWWDRNIPPGKRYSQIIGDELAAARSIIVLWSRTSVASDWVRDEAQEGVNRGILVPVLIEKVDMPYGFRQHQTANLSDWDGSASHPEMRMLLDSLSKLVSVPAVPGDPPPLKREPPPSGRRAPLIAGVAALAIMAAAYFAYRSLPWGAETRHDQANENRASNNVNGSSLDNRNGRPDQAARDRAIKFTVDGIEKASSGNYEGAILMYNTAVEADPGYAEAYFYRAQSYVVTKQSGKAVADFKKVLELKPDDERRAKVTALLADLQAPPPPPDKTTAPPSDAVRAQVRQMFSPSKVARIESTTSLIASNKQDAKAMSLALSTAKADPSNKSGVINTLVLLESMDPQILKAHKEEIEELLKLVSNNGPETQDHVRKVRAIMGGITGN
ncbi:MAG TPA: TIR domain-containing protein [Blastocatellia bacterium]|jgi:tetratricopeptide (TPR) repeat protein|nr:TIR domain-containing protein [Blastocatellia bacterium]